MWGFSARLLKGEAWILMDAEARAAAAATTSPLLLMMSKQDHVLALEYFSFILYFIYIYIYIICLKLH